MASASFCLFLTLVVHIHNFMCSSASASAIHFGNETDLQALVEIRVEIQGDPFQALSSWNASNATRFCEWSGVSCGHLYDRRVTALNLSSLGLVGSLSPSIGNLTFLRGIHFQGNGFKGGIPGEIGRLSRLEDLVLANNSFQGEIPGNLTHCSSLRVLDLSGNSLRGRIPDRFGLFTKLHTLDLSRNQFSGRIPPSLGNISSLQSLVLMRNNLSGNIPTEISRLSSLQTLWISSNQLSGNVPTQIFNISTLHQFSITDNLLTGEFPSTMGLTLPNLVLFEAAFNQFHGSIPATLANASGLTKISVGANALSGPIPLNLGTLKQLDFLNFGGNLLGTHKANDISFISSLTNSTNLQVLDLSTIQISGNLPNAIANLSTKLAHLWLDENIITGSLPPGIENLENLSCLNVRNNILTGSIPDSLGKLTNLQRLFLSENMFTGEIPSSLGKILGLQLLALDHNALTGSIPVSLSNCTHIESLDLSANLLSGSLPEQVLGLSSLSISLLLNQNQFNGTIPMSVGNLVHLQELDISENKLYGEIPSSLGGCEMLQVLYLEGNFLEGTIPSSLGQLKNIEVMNLSRNNLSGKIPASLAKLKFISTLNLSYNMLEGQVPEDGAFMNTSLLSVVGNKNLCGGAKSLNLSSCPESPDPKQNKHKPKLSTVEIVVIAVCTLIAFLASAYAIRKLRGLKKKPCSTHIDDKRKLMVSYKEKELYDCTNSFSPENLIGEGRYGAVYKGLLKLDEMEEIMVAVKVLKLHHRGAEKSFLAECEALRNIRHRNLVKNITACSSQDFSGNDFKALIFEYAPNGSLDSWLHPHLSSSDQEEQAHGLKKLKLIDRLNIVIDIASALEYLHHRHGGTPIVHCDLKPGNILLHDDLRALVTDFGLAKFVPGVIEDESHSSTAVRGTVGYVAPEYGMGGEISAQGDVYSYGIMLLELFTGKRPTEEMFTEDFGGIRSYVKMALPDRVMKIVDPRMSEEEGKAETRSMRLEKLCLLIFQIGVSCSAEIKRERMDIKDALCRLQAIRYDLSRT